MYMFFRITSILNLISPILLAPVVLSGPSSDTRLITPEIDKYIRTVFQQWNLTGVALAVVRQDPESSTGWYQEFQSYGIARADGTPVTPDTLFPLASNSKLFTALSVDLLFSNESLKSKNGRSLTWSTKASDVFGDLWGLMDEEASRGTTIQDMLSHHTGLPRHDGSNGRIDRGLADKISKLRYLRPSAELRALYQYNNLMYDSLGYLPEILTNQSLAHYVTQHFFVPLNMTSSTYSVAEAEEGPIAHGFQISGQDLKRGLEGTKKATVPYYHRPGREEIDAGSGGVISSAKDMATWMSMLMALGKHPYRNQTIIASDFVEHAATGVSVVTGRGIFPEMSAQIYGGGQTITSYRGYEIVEHGGNVLGFASRVSRLLNNNLGIVLLNNDAVANMALDAIKWRIIDEHVVRAAVPGSPVIDWNSRYLDLTQTLSKNENFFTPRPRNAHLPNIPLSELEQRGYSHPAYGILQPCLVPTSPLPSPNIIQERLEAPNSRCSSVLSSLPVQRLLNMTDLSIPTFIIPFQGMETTHIRLSHFTANVFNATAMFTNAEMRLKEGLGMIDENGRWIDDEDVIVPLSDFLVEWVTDGEEGISLRGDAWGMGGGAKEPSGRGKDGAEVWFARIY